RPVRGARLLRVRDATEPPSWKIRRVDVVTWLVHRPLLLASSTSSVPGSKPCAAGRRCAGPKLPAPDLRTCVLDRQGLRHPVSDGRDGRSDMARAVAAAPCFTALAACATFACVRKEVACPSVCRGSRSGG